MADEYNPYDLGFTGVGGTGTGSMYVLPGEGGGERADTGLTVPTDDSGYIGETGLPSGTQAGTPGIGWGTPGGLGTFLTDIQQGRLTDAIGGLFSGRTGGALGQMAAFGGLAALLNKMFGDNSQKPVGYQGGIPKYTYERTQTPMAQQRPAGYRPGQGGIAYFAPGRFTPAGYTPKTAEEFLVRPTAPAQESGGGGVVPLPGSDMIQSSNTSSGLTGDRLQAEMIDPGYQGTGKVMATSDLPTLAASGGYMPGGIAMLAKGRFLKGNGDGVSDSIPARFAGSGQEARLADGEFVIPARVVSELGNGSSDAGARKLYAMLDRVEARAKKSKRGKPSGADRELNKLA
jgi:hypothetical protein